MILVVVLSEIQQNCTALKDIEVVAGAIGDRRNAAVGVEHDEPRLFLHLLRKVNPDCFVVRPAVLRTQFLKKRGNFEPVRGACGV